MNQSRHSQLMDLVDCSRRMQAQADAGDWEAVVRLQTRHREMSESFFMEPVGAELAPACAVAIREMLLNNRRIAELGARERRACVNGKRDFDKHRHAVRAYRDNTG
jgi:hypothetical protein